MNRMCYNCKYRNYCSKDKMKLKFVSGNRLYICDSFLLDDDCEITVVDRLRRDLKENINQAASELWSLLTTDHGFDDYDAFLHANMN